jgi:hypothetical protein
MKYPTIPNRVGGQAAEFHGDYAEVISPLDGSHVELDSVGISRL